MATIYSIKNPEGRMVYIGSTTLPLNIRMSNHKSDARLNKGHCLLYQIMRETDPNLFTIESLIDVELELRFRMEGHHIQANGTHVSHGGLNQNWAGRTAAERNREYRQAHPEVIRAQRHRRAQRQAEARVWAHELNPDEVVIREVINGEHVNE